MLSEISQEDKNHMISLTYTIKENPTKQETNQAYRHRERIGGCKRWECGVSEMGEEDQNAPTSSRGL